MAEVKRLKQKQIQFYMDETLYQWVSDLAVQTERSRGQMVRLILKEKMNAELSAERSEQ